MSWLKIAHRGASGTRPELTRAAFERAIELGAEMIELDVQLTRDRRLVVLHDRELGRTVKGAGVVRDCTLDDLRALDAGSWFGPEYAAERVPALDEVLAITDGRAELIVEIKSPERDWEETARVLVALLAESRRLQRTVISCFDVGALACVRARTSEAVLGVLWEQTDFAAAWDAAERLRARFVHPYWALASADLIGQAHSRGLRVLAWTVNDIEAMRLLVANGIDGIMSDFPERFCALAPPGSWSGASPRPRAP